MKYIRYASIPDQQIHTKQKRYIYEDKDITEFIDRKLYTIINLVSSKQNIPYNRAQQLFLQSNTFKIFEDVQNDFCFESSEAIYDEFEREQKSSRYNIRMRRLRLQQNRQTENENKPFISNVKYNINGLDIQIGFLNGKPKIVAKNKRKKLSKKNNS